MPFREHPVRVRVPATSANLGSGYDSFGLALDRHDEVTASVTADGLVIELADDDDQQLALDETHLVVRSMRACFELLGGQPPGLRLHCVNRIPHGRGLGSSAAAIVAGIQLARVLHSDGNRQLDDAGALALATELEGHPDNVAACLLGGLTIAWLADGVGRAVRLNPTGVSPVLFIPPQRSATRAARAVLPEQVPHADAAFNLGRAALLPLALTGRPELLLTATEDRLHQGYRAGGMPASSELVERLRSQQIAAVVSGAGPTVLALAVGDQAERAAVSCPAGWECAVLGLTGGARTEILPIAK
jgi:homoserine kinase